MTRAALDRTPSGRPAWVGASGFSLVAAAAALWGTDALFRRGLALEEAAVTVVFWEHAILVLLTAPFLARVPWRRLDRRAIVSIVLVGVGASAVATVLFTSAFARGDPNTPLLLQKLQPFVAVVGARFLLGERTSRRFWQHLAAAIVAGWLITFPDPLSVTWPRATTGLLAGGAAVLWGMGTVLGRDLTSVLRPMELVATRFAVGLPAAAVLLAVVPGGSRAVVPAIQDHWLALVLLALVPGLLSIRLYYRGLEQTPASAATIAEMAFPLTALVVNFLVFGSTVTMTQGLGIAALSAVLLRLSAVGRERPALVGVAHAPRPVTP